MSVNIYLGHISKSTDSNNIGMTKDIISGLTFKSERLFDNRIKEINNNKRFKFIKANCHFISKKFLKVLLKEQE